MEGLGEHEGRDDVDVEAVGHHLGLDAGEAGQVGDAAVVDQAPQAERGGQRLKCVPIRFMKSRSFSNFFSRTEMHNTAYLFDDI